MALVPVMYLARPNAAYFGYAGVLLDLALFVFVLSVALAEPRQGVRRVLAWRPLQVLGRYSFPLYLWHYPIFWYLSRNAVDWGWGGRAVLGIGLSIVISVVTMRIIEKPLQRWLAGDQWRQAVADGLVRTLVRKVRESVTPKRTGGQRASAAEGGPGAPDLEPRADTKSPAGQAD